MDDSNEGDASGDNDNDDNDNDDEGGWEGVLEINAFLPFSCVCVWVGEGRERGWRGSNLIKFYTKLFIPCKKVIEIQSLFQCFGNDHCNKLGEPPFYIVPSKV